MISPGVVASVCWASFRRPKQTLSL